MCRLGTRPDSSRGSKYLLFFVSAVVYHSRLEARWRRSHTPLCELQVRPLSGYLTAREISEPLAVHRSFSGSAADAFITRRQMCSRCGSLQNSGNCALSPTTCSSSPPSSSHVRHVPLRCRNRSAEVERKRKKTAAALVFSALSLSASESFSALCLAEGLGCAFLDLRHEEFESSPNLHFNHRKRTTHIIKKNTNTGGS